MYLSPTPSTNFIVTFWNFLAQFCPFVLYGGPQPHQRRAHRYPCKIQWMLPWASRSVAAFSEGRRVEGVRARTSTPLNCIEFHHRQKSSQKNKASCSVPESRETIKVTQVNQDSCALSVCHSAFMIQESLQFKPNFYPTARPQGGLLPPRHRLIWQRVLAWGS